MANSLREYILENLDKSKETKVTEEVKDEVKEAEELTEADHKELQDLKRSIENYHKNLVRSLDYVLKNDAEASIGKRAETDADVLNQFYACKYVYDELKNATDLKSAFEAVQDSNFIKSLPVTMKSYVKFALNGLKAKIK
jgi:hypothetical protein